MSNSILELRLTGSMPVAQDMNVIFDEPPSTPPGIAYDSSRGIITFNEAGQYSVKWWVATETALRGGIEFSLVSPQGVFTPTPGCSPIKTGQVTGFGVIDVASVGTTLTLKNKSSTNVNTVISRKTRTKAYLLITPIGSSANRVYRGNISTSGSYIDVPLANDMYYRLEYLSSTTIQLRLIHTGGPIRYDFRRLSGVDGGAAMEGSYADFATLNGSLIIDTPIYNNSREMHWVMVRIQNPDTNLWSLFEIRHFVSGAGARATIWVSTIEENVSY